MGSTLSTLISKGSTWLTAISNTRSVSSDSNVSQSEESKTQKEIPLPTFRKFPELDRDIRLLIWEFATLDKKVVDISTVYFRRSGAPGTVRYLQIDNCKPRRLILILSSIGPEC